MLSAEDNELICRTGPDTPMGNLFRRYWLPVLLSHELDVDGSPRRVKILGEELVAFRDTDGKVGLLDERCPHRGSSMFYGLNEKCGLMCVYHGFKFDVTGRCVDTPSAKPGSAFKDKLRATSYPTLESAGMVWAYMGPPEKRPPLQRFNFTMVPPEQVTVTRTPVYCNYLQSMEGNIDSTHIGTLHRAWADWEPVDDGTDRPGHPSMKFSNYLRARYRYAEVDVQDTDYGFRLIAIRDTPAGNQYVRINNHVLPSSTLISPTDPSIPGSWVIMVPVDDENCLRFGVNHSLGPVSDEQRQQTRRTFGQPMDPNDPTKRLHRLENDYLIDRHNQKTKTVSGIFGIATQDYAMTESMRPIMDRTREHLYEADSAIIRCRQMLLKSARDLEKGIDPPALDPEIPFEKIRSEDIIIGPEEDPWLVAVDAGETTPRGMRLR